jgi:hypothetical protein
MANTTTHRLANIKNPDKEDDIYLDEAIDLLGEEYQAAIKLLDSAADSEGKAYIERIGRRREIEDFHVPFVKYLLVDVEWRRTLEPCTEIRMEWTDGYDSQPPKAPWWHFGRTTAET